MRNRKLLLFVNPFGGKGSAIAIWNRIKDIFGMLKLIFSYCKCSSRCFQNPAL